MEPQIARANITRFYIYKALASFGLWTPIWVLYLQQRRGLSLGEITVMDAGFWAVLALAEIPTGAVADTFGRKTSMVVGIALQAFSFGIYGLATTFPALFAANLLWGVAISFVSGAD